jgi:hypothetical protein
MLLLLPPPEDERIPRYRHERRNNLWEEHVVMCRYTGEFVAKHHMTESSFNKLVDLLTPQLHVDEVKSRNCTGGIQPIDPRIIVATGLRWLGGEHHKSLSDIFRISRASTWRVVGRFIGAVIDNIDNIQLLTTAEELELVATGWRSKSTADGCYHGLVLALDGFLSIRTQPGKNECANTAEYFSGHKKIPAINVQAAVDHQLRFRYVCVAAPGKTNDGRAFSVECMGLQEWLQNLDDKYFVCADNAYPMSNKLLVPFKGAQAQALYHSSYNFYLSQLRIRVEMAFGRMTTKFRVLRGKMSCTLVNQSKVIQTVTRLHNFIIDNDKPDLGPIRLNPDGTIDPAELALFGVEPLEVGENIEIGEGPLGNLGFVAFDALEYDPDEGDGARDIPL